MKNSKKLKILLLTDRLSLGGAETHILSLYRSLSALGHCVTVVSSGGELSKDLRHVTIDLSSHSPLKLICGYFRLRALIHKEGFDLIHAHARLPALIASLAISKSKIPLVTTVHARFRSDGLRGKLSAWGFRSVAVSEDLRFYLSQNYSIATENISVIENGIDFDRYRKSKTVFAREGKPITLLFLSRLDRDCSLSAELLCSIAPSLCKRYGNIKIVIGGGGECFNNIKERADFVNSALKGNVISVLGEVTDVPKFLSCGDVFVGVSRCALEAIAATLPVVISGNEGFFGRLTVDNFSSALASNFCARGKALPDEDCLFEALCEVIDAYFDAQKEAEILCTRARNLLDISVIAPRYEDFYYRTLEDYAHFKERTVKTLLCGYYGFSNLGDDALLRVAIKRVRDELGASVGAFTNSPKKSAKRFFIPCYSRLSPFGIFYRILKCDRVVFGGGTLFQDVTSRRSLLYYVFVLRLALGLKKDVLLYANGIGELKEGKVRAALFKCLAHCSYIGVRDLRSFAVLRKELGASAPIVLENDLALSLSVSSTYRTQFLLDIAFKSNFNDFFVVCPHFRASRFDLFELELAIRKQKNMGRKALFIPCFPDDFDIAYDLKLKFGGGLLYFLSFSDLLSIFKMAKCVISMRYHPLLAARTSSVPYLPIGSDPKIEEFL